MSRQITFQHDTRHRRAIARILRGLVATVVADARDEGYQGRTVTVRIRFTDFETLTRQMTLRRPSLALSTIAGLPEST